jgi:endonuclease YncB( thermonuclease family)
MKRRIKSLFMGMCASLIVLALVAFFNTALKDSPLTAAINEYFAPQPTATITPTPAVLGEKISTASAERAVIKRVVDGDTVELENGQRLRYIGIDAPESKKPNTPVQCFAEAAMQRNKELVEGKEVYLFRDVSDKDRFQRLLRYVVVVESDIFVNEALVKEGFAFSRSYPPDIAKQDQLRQAEAEARTTNKGVWGNCEIIPATKKNESAVGN